MEGLRLGRIRAQPAAVVSIPAFTRLKQCSEQSKDMLYVVEIRRGHGELSMIMARIREWLDAQRFEPDAFRCSTDETTVTCRLEFRLESAAIACAREFDGEVRPLGDKTTG
jgi:hypothetical protein